MSETPSNTAFVVAAISVIVFSLVGVGVMTGIIPSAVWKTASPATSVKKNTRTPAQDVAPLQLNCADCGRVERVSLVYPAQGADVTALPQSAGENDRQLQRYEVLVRLPDGTARTFVFDIQPAFRVGDTVKIVGETLLAI